MHSHQRRPLSLLLIALAAVPLCAQAPRGVPLFEAGDWAGAKAELFATIQRNDRNARAHYYLGRLAMLDDDADAAAAQFERAVARDQAQALARIDAARGHLAFARLAIAAKDTSTAEREVQAAIASAPDMFRPYSALASWYAKDKRWPEAFAALEPYIKKHPDDPYGPYGIGRIAALSGQQLDRGEKGIRAFIAKPPKDAGALVLSGAYRRLGLILEFEGKHAEARSAIEQALILDPRNEEAKKAMK